MSPSGSIQNGYKPYPAPRKRQHYSDKIYAAPELVRIQKKPHSVTVTWVSTNFDCTLDLDVSIRIRKGTGPAEVAADLSKHQHYSKLCQVPE